jgi:hypothetical protein
MHIHRSQDGQRSDGIGSGLIFPKLGNLCYSSNHTIDTHLITIDSIHLDEAVIC